MEWKIKLAQLGFTVLQDDKPQLYLRQSDVEKFIEQELTTPELTEKLKELLRQVYDILTEAPELNMNNYDEEQVKKLNDKMIEAYCLLNYEQRQFSV